MHFKGEFLSELSPKHITDLLGVISISKILNEKESWKSYYTIFGYVVPLCTKFNIKYLFLWSKSLFFLNFNLFYKNPLMTVLKRQTQCLCVKHMTKREKFIHLLHYKNGVKWDHY